MYVELVCMSMSTKVACGNLVIGVSVELKDVQPE